MQPHAPHPGLGFGASETAAADDLLAQQDALGCSIGWQQGMLQPRLTQGSGALKVDAMPESISTRLRITWSKLSR